MIEIRNVTKQYYNLRALDNISLTIPRGEVLGVLGPNGAGKSTLFKLVAGLTNPNGGRIRPTGKTWPAMGYKPDRLLFPNHLRIYQYMEMVAGLANIPNKRIKQEVQQSLERVDLLEFGDKKIKDCSKGMRQRLGLAQVLIGDPPLILLDEPSNGLDPEGQADMSRRIQRLHAAGKTIVMSSHQLHEVTQICTQLVILNRGRIHYQNSMHEALATRGHVQIQANKDLTAIASFLKQLHPEVEVNGKMIMLGKGAAALRRQILMILLRTNYDIVSVEQIKASLAEIYAEAVR